MGREAKRKGSEQNFPRDSPGDGGTMGVTTMTNGDKIRSMTDEELEDFFLFTLYNDVCPPDTSCCPTNEKIILCCNCWKNWLKQEVQE